MLVAAVVIWFSLFVMLFSILAAPMIAWWIRRKPSISNIFTKVRKNKKNSPPPEYKIVEVEYKIIDK